MEQDHSPRPYRFQENNQYPSNQDFDDIVQNYLDKLSFKKRDKALIDRERYELILQVLQEPKNTSVSTAQFRFWVKKMFQLVPLHNGRLVVCHDNKPVAMREQIYHILIWAHRQSHHGGRDKTSTLVRRRFSWIPKELIARFVRHCPFCITRRNGHADMFSTYATMQNHYQRQQTDSTYLSEESTFMNSISNRSSNTMSQSHLSSPPTDPIPCCFPNMLPAPNHNSDTTDAAGPLPVPSSATSVLSDDVLCPLPSSSSSSTHSAALTTSSSSTSTTATTNSPSSSGLPPPPSLYTEHHHPQCCFPPPPSLSQPSPEEIFIKDTASSLTNHFTPTTTTSAPTNNSNSCFYAHQQQRNQQQVRMDGYGFMHVNTMDPTPTFHRHQEQQSMLASPTSPLSPTTCDFEPKRSQPVPPFVNQQSLNLMSFF